MKSLNAGVRIPADCTYVRRAAKELHCTTRTIRRYIRDGKIRAHRVGQRYWAVSRFDVTLLAGMRSR